MIRTELPILLGLTVVAGVIVLDGALGRIDAVVLLTLFALFLFWSARFQRVDTTDPLAAEAVREVPAAVPERSVWISVLIPGVGLALLVLGSRGVVWGAVGIARAAGISDLVIGLTVVAVVGIAGVIAPFGIERVSITRDLPVMAGLTVLMLLF